MPEIPVSVLLPVRDAERTLPAALESLRRQTLGEWELVAVDDGSRDGSRALLEAAAARDPRVRVFSGPPAGI
ncbi:MAG TPA: glycosyltransferase, partial [Planctomycetota bacterium]|nr:glycosyltransferase [Planctomycetota bacterium]